MDVKETIKKTANGKFYLKMVNLAMAKTQFDIL
jgi:hypothetical protein